MSKQSLVLKQDGAKLHTTEDKDSKTKKQQQQINNNKKNTTTIGNKRVSSSSASSSVSSNVFNNAGSETEIYKFRGNACR